MNDFLDFFLLLLTQFAGGPGATEDNLVRYGLSALMWGVLWLIAWYRQRQQPVLREKWLVWGFGLAFARELFMFWHIAGHILGFMTTEMGNLPSEPLEHTLAMAAMVVVAAAFLRYLLDNISLAHRYLQTGLAATLICFAATAWWWTSTLAVNPAIKFHQTWAGWLFHLVALGFIAGAIFLLARAKGWLRNVVILALLFWGISELRVLVNYATNRTLSTLICPVGNTFQMLAIPLLGYVYIRELFIERKQAEDALLEYQDHLEELVLARTNDLSASNRQLQQEIGERVRIEEALRDSEARFRRVISSISDHIYMTEISPDGRRTNRYISPNVEALSGYPADVFMADWNFWPAQVIHPDDRAIAAAHALHLSLDDTDEIEYRLVKPDGQVVWVRDSARIEPHGTSKIIFGVVGDITARKQTEQALEQLSRQNTLILDSAGEGIFGVDVQGCHTFVNPAAARMLGYLPEELVGKPSHSTWHHTRSDGSPYPEADCPLHNGYKNGVVCRGDDQIFWRKDGTAFPARFTSTPIYEQGRLLGAVVVFQDISARKQAEAELGRRNAQVAALEERQRIAAEMHDGLAQTLSYLGHKMDAVTELAAKGHNRSFADEYDHLRRTIDQASREVRRSIASLQEEPEPPQSLQEQLQTIIAGFNDNGGPPVQLIAPDQPALFLPGEQAEQIQRVVQEGLLNALRHARASRVIITLEHCQQNGRLTIEDNGQGFDPATPPADNQGHFGLQIMRARAARIGGQVQVESSPGQGTRLTFIWPLFTQAATPVLPAAALMPADEGGPYA